MVRVLERDFPALLRPTFSAATMPHGIVHHLPTEGPPVHAKVRRLSPENLEAAKKEFLELEQLGLVRKSNSPWSSPLHIHVYGCQE